MLSLQIITSFDTVLFNWCQRRLQMHAAVALISRYISRFGGGFIYVSIGVLLACLDAQHGVVFLYSCLFAFAIARPLFRLLKNIVRRDRPCERLSLNVVISPVDTFSFPSEHTAFAFVFATTLSETYPGVALLAYSIATLIGLSRIILGVHYPADILAGAVLGVICADMSMGLSGVLGCLLWSGSEGYLLSGAS